MADYAKKRLHQERAKLSTDPWRFQSEWLFPERDSLNWENLKKAHFAGRKIAEEQKAYNATLADYKDEARERLKRERYENVTRQKYEDFQNKIVAPLRSEARSRVAVAEAEALQLPEHPFYVAAAMRALDRVYKGVNSNGSKKLTLPKLEQLPAATLRAIAATDPIVSGVSEENHQIIRKKVFAEEGGVKLAEAQEFLVAVKTASEALDYGQTIAELEAGVETVSEEVERGRKARAEMEERREEAAQDREAKAN